MDATTQAFVTEIVSRRIAENWLYWLLFLAASFLAAFAGAYIKRRAENLATRDDFEELKRQLAQNTRVTEEIKAEIGHAEWKAREANSLRRIKVEELVRYVLEEQERTNSYFRESIVGKASEMNTSSADAACSIASLYFPNLRIPVYAFAQQVYVMVQDAAGIQYDVSMAISQGRLDDYRMHTEQAKLKFSDHCQALATLRAEVETVARAEMDALLYVER
ncbi:hypothetical protein QTN24_15740 [Cupriavidus sp. SZY C1]|uniref:hypothetical protein n=1 Tax=Cupriavidus sp. SZY C1 TaxID=3055037 RepID=UPI0028B7922A|nr:hypothetical protein [Cupriavidus sp. SZY C1]MDT6962950.1 hypothetical protein [Cupriavidus sp. SZY C1]